ncbi:fluoride efflux transporter FluC [Cellulomonas composti]|uniref:Fluoride-specific ion channel FluC n=1 Tax=Cellulomonas composti TaxID=266130 RepID=A0A511J9F1_9CELL|nr:CrcB family protein [Cellulomonas composti]GEL94625.1 hypothetical protein CCO02nite_12830 [Cellulomonas composti]
MIVLVALAGGLGAGLRFVVDGLIGRVNRTGLPLGTFVVNVTGAFALGLVTALALDHTGLTELKLVVGTGMLGGYTTFSAASVEAVTIARREGPRATLLAALHATAMLVTGLAAAALGLAVG